MLEMNYETRHEAIILCEKNFGDFGIVVVSYGSHPCAYIRVPDELIKKIETREGCKSSEDGFYDYVDAYPHGGFTYFGTGSFSDEIIKGNYLGWDYAHAGDYTYTDIPEMGLFFNNYGEKKWTTKEIYDEALEVLSELRTNYEFK